MKHLVEAARWKWRFETPRGLVTVEDLWDLSLENLDKVAIALHKKIECGAPISFIGVPSAGCDESRKKLTIVTEIIEIKLAEHDALKVAHENEGKKARILEILAEKQDGALLEKTEDELKKMLDEL